MIIFLAGPDDYRAKEKLKELISAYQKKHASALGLLELDLEEEKSWEELKNFLNLSSIFVEAKLAIGKNLFQSPHLKKIEAFLKNSDLSKSKSNFLILLAKEAKPQELKEEERPFWHWLWKNSRYREIFEFFPNYQKARAWLLKEVKKRGLLIEESALRFLYENFSSDHWRLINELEKIALFKNGERIKKEDLFQVISSEYQPHFYQIFDSFLAQNKRKALFYLQEALKAGLEPAMIFNSFVNQVRNLILLSSGKKIEIAPYLLKKIRSQLWRWQNKKEKLLEIYQALAQRDLQIKKGQIDYELALERIFTNFL